VMHPVGIEPGVQFYTSLMRFLYPEFQGVVIRLRSQALLSCEVVGPWFKGAFIESVTLRSYLENYCIQIQECRRVKKVYGFGLLRICT